MKRYLKIEVPNVFALEILERLRSRGLEPLWTIEGDGVYEIAVPEEGKSDILSLEISYEEIEVGPIDWKSQWASFAKGEENEGIYEIDFKTLGLNKDGHLLLKAGPGFGDLSHPTTRLMLKMMLEACEGRSCIDIGSGSGILSVAAAIWGAKEVFACDIDQDAVSHTQESASLNHLDEKVKVFLPGKLWKHIANVNLIDPIILINMIEKEQKEALPEHFSENFGSLTVISSGIVTSDKDSYLSWMKKQGFVLKDYLEEEGWSAFLFKT